MVKSFILSLRSADNELRDSNANAFIDENGSLYQIETDALQKEHVHM
jgi:hypothetical protein